MTFVIEESEGGRLLALCGSGSIDDTQYVESHRLLFEMLERVRIAERILVNWTGVESFRVSTSAIREVAELEALATRSSSRAGMIAVVAPQDLAFGLARMSEAFTGESTWKTSVFRDRASAMAWIGSAPDSAAGEL